VGLVGWRSHISQGGEGFVVLTAVDHRARLAKNELSNGFSCVLDAHRYTQKGNRINISVEAPAGIQSVSTTTLASPVAARNIPLTQEASLVQAGLYTDGMVDSHLCAIEIEETHPGFMVTFDMLDELKRNEITSAEELCTACGVAQEFDQPQREKD